MLESLSPNKNEDDFACASVMSLVQENIQTTLTNTVRKYLNSSLNFGFTFTDSENRLLPQCVVCEEILSNESMVSSKLKRHLNIKQNHLPKKYKIYFS